MDSKSIKTLEFDKIIDMLQQHVTSTLGAELVNKMQIFTSCQQVKHQLQATSEARYLIAIERFSLKGLKDIRPTLRRVKINAEPSIEGLVDISSTLKCFAKALKLIYRKSDKVPLIFSIVEGMDDLKFIVDEIDSCIDEYGNVRDNASSKLYDIRRKIRLYESQVKSKVESIVQSPKYSKYLQDSIVTMRQDRYVVPVKFEYRNQVPGIVHDRSASGSTLFIEPIAVVEANNKLREWEQKEIKEVQRIIRELGDLLHSNYTQLEAISDVLGILDVLNARGRLSLAMDAIEPKVNDQKYISLKKAKHPLISKAEVVPIDIHLGKDYNVLIVTGPNTGGKTVTLKLMGLFQLMAQSGLHIPADINSEVSVFNNILADIGDEQSIEQSLSTFSSHLTNIIRLLENADENSLILLDELGAGTDPVEGAALAMSIIDELQSRNSYVMATTHYSELKAYAYNRDNIINGSVEFDVETLRPTYNLLIGIPGRSNALLIAERLGLPKDIIEGATRYVSSDEKHVESMISDLETNRKKTELAFKEVELMRQESSKLLNDYREKMENLAKYEKEVKRQAALDAKKYVADMQKELEYVISNLKTEVKDIEDKRQLEESIKVARQLVSEKQKSVSQEAKTLYKNPLTESNSDNTHNVVDLQKGMKVKHKKWAYEGVVISNINDKQQVQVQFGAMKMWVDHKLLEQINEPKNIVSSVTLTRSEESRQVSLELDIRGNTILDAEDIIDRYLDSAILSARNEVYIIHGKGTGALRDGVRDYLRKHTYVKSMRFGGPGEGGHGVTVVELKK